MQGFPLELCNFRLLDYTDSKYERLKRTRDIF